MIRQMNPWVQSQKDDLIFIHYVMIFINQAMTKTLKVFWTNILWKFCVTKADCANGLCAKTISEEWFNDGLKTIINFLRSRYDLSFTNGCLFKIISKDERKIRPGAFCFLRTVAYYILLIPE
jgi:hypothetical protein